MNFKAIKALLLICLAVTIAKAAGQRKVIQIDADQARQRTVAREKWQMQGRRVPGLNSAILRQRAIQQKLQMRTALSSSSVPVGASWSSFGPLPLPSDASGIGVQDYGWVSGRATAVAIDPNDAAGNTVFAGGAYAGVWKSTNAGPLSFNPSSVNWIPLTDAQATLAIGAIAIQTQLSNPNSSASLILAGTGETNSSADSYYGLGILRSADGGNSWTLISQDASGTHSFAGLGFSQIAFSTTNPNLVIAAAASATQGFVEGLENPVAINRGLYDSIDAGVTWHSASVTDAGVAIAPSSATAVVYNGAAARFYAAIRFHGFYSSPDGINWTRLAAQPGALTAINCPTQTAQTSVCPLYRGEIAVVPGRAGLSGLGEMYVWFVDANQNDQGIWQSLDGGASWTQINDSGITNCGDLFGGCGTEQGAYNLALAAVPDGTATDLYAGAVNVYKCVITNAFPSCNGTGRNTFVNLTHVYGCSDIAKVHPDQHAMDFLVVNGTALLYFANDGGIYRALDGFTGLTTGTCGLTNQFDSLNETLGPMTQFVSVSESATDVDLIFGGTQDNGAPATAFSQSGGSWVNVNAGDDGYTAVNPANGNEWFVAAPPDSQSGVNLFRCANGINCRTQDFDNDQVADSNELGGDTAAFYFPFILDPASFGALLIGTCRIWRGASVGGGFSVLSPDFETGGTGACSGAETNMVRALAVGGPKDSSSYSQVIYAGTNGEGPSIPTSPSGGHLWVTTNADTGATAWIDRTGAINPNSFPISAVALDPADATGNTAYVTIMGFHTSHVWKTANAGVSWTDFTGNLPDAPVNSIVFDAGKLGTIYVGTDVGVFASSTASASWTEVGPGLGQPGFLPNVAVTSLQIFNSGGLKRLRAATYGRGIWEWNLITTPDFQLKIGNNPQTVFAASSATFNGAISALNGYNSSVNLSCSSGSTPVPQTCSVAPTSVSPTSTGASFVVTAAGNVGDYSFNLHATGTDAASVAHDFALTLHVVDFSLSAPSPSAVTVSPGVTSTPVSLTVSASGAFDEPIALSCAGLPATASCVFQPSNTVSPTSNIPVTVTLNIVTTSTTPAGNFQITISAAASGGPTKTQPLTLTIGAAADYTLAISNPSLTAQLNAAAVFNGTLASVNGYNSAVALSCGSGAPSSCVVSPSSAIPTSAGVPFTATASSGAAQTYSFNINAVGSDPAKVAHSAAVSLIVLPAQNFDFAISATPTSASVPVGQTALFTVGVSPNTGSFSNAVAFSCTNLPNLSTCTFNPSQVGAGSGNSTVAPTITTTAPGHAMVSTVSALLIFPLWSWLLIPRRRHRKAWRRSIALAVVLLAIFWAACGGGLQGGSSGGSGNPGTQKGTYQVTINAASGSVSHTAQVSLTVK